MATRYAPICAVNGFGDKWFQQFSSFVDRRGRVQVQEVFQDDFAVFGQNRLRVELYAKGWVLAMLERHHFAIGAGGGDFQFGRHWFVNHQ